MGSTDDDGDTYLLDPDPFAGGGSGGADAGATVATATVPAAALAAAAAVTAVIMSDDCCEAADSSKWMLFTGGWGFERTGG